MNFVWADLRYAWRAARRSPGVTLAIIAMLALGTGGVTAVFNPIYSQIFAPLPFPQPEQLVIIGGDIPLFNDYFSRFERRDELDRIFSNLAAYQPYFSESIHIPYTGKYKYNPHILSVTEEFFETLGVRPIRGNIFSRVTNHNDIVISYRFWRDEFSRADDAIGELISIDNLPFTVIGVMPESFDFSPGTDIWVNKDGQGWSVRFDGQLIGRFIGRLRPGMSPVWATKEIEALAGVMRSPELKLLKTVYYGDRAPLLWMLGVAAVLFLLLVCAGVMNLLVTQGTRRKSEMALRLTLGATRRNLVFQLLCETLPLVVLGALAGLWLSETVNAWLTARFPTLSGGEVVVPVKMAFFAALVFAVTIIGGLTPALYASGVDLNTYLKSGEVSKRRFFSLRELLTGAQLALALALLIGIGLLLRGTMFNINIPIEWSSRGTVVVMAYFQSEPESRAESVMRRNTMLFQEFKNHLETMPEVAAVGILRPIPFSREAELGDTSPSIASKTRQTQLERGAHLEVVEGYASPEAFGILGIPLIAGRPFTEADATNELEIEIEIWGNRRSPDIVGKAIINQSLAQQFWPGENALGKIIYSGISGMVGVPREIVGVVRDFHQVGNHKKFIPSVYRPIELYSQEQRFIVKLRSSALMKDFRQRLSSLDMSSPHTEVRWLSNYVAESTANMRLTLQLIGGFALMGIMVAGLGVYSTTSLMIAAMNREMGIRMAMGAQKWDIIRLSLWRGTRAILLGLPVGLFMAWILSRVLSSFLFQVKVDDPIAWIISCAVLLGITTVAALIPALRAARVNPMDAMKNE